MTPEVGTSGFWPTQAEIFPLAIENLYPNLYYTWVAGESVRLVNPSFSQQFFNPGDNVDLIIPQLRNKGLSDAANVSLTLTSDNPLITVTSGPINIGNIASRTTVNNNQNLTFTIGGTMPADINVKMLVTVSTAGTAMLTDTLTFITGTPIMVFADTTNDPLLLWNITATPSIPKWEATNLSFHSSPTSFTDSKTGEYSNNATVTMILKNAINLSAYSHPRLSFWTKYDIETNWDYGQVEISTNNGTTWFPLTGLYTNPGNTSGFQPPYEPLYDGIQTNWVNEIMDLTNYITSQVKLKFELKTDGSVEKDGWFVDDIGILVYGIVPVELSSFTASVQNVNILLNWITSTESNNMGFEVERASLSASPPRDWEKLGFVNGNGNSNSPKSYSFTDES
ncbi:MAG: immune inhibitor A, partial [Ignavibacteria bacterium]|nr:immune inhibitor A [Ignavibacteria bacterium]